MKNTITIECTPGEIMDLFDRMKESPDVWDFEDPLFDFLWGHITGDGRQIWIDEVQRNEND